MLYHVCLFGQPVLVHAHEETCGVEEEEKLAGGWPSRGSALVTASPRNPDEGIENTSANTRCRGSRTTSFGDVGRCSYCYFTAKCMDGRTVAIIAIKKGDKMLT